MVISWRLSRFQSLVQWCLKTLGVLKHSRASCFILAQFQVPLSCEDCVRGCSESFAPRFKCFFVSLRSVSVLQGEHSPQWRRIHMLLFLYISWVSCTRGIAFSGGEIWSGCFLYDLVHRLRWTRHKLQIQCVQSTHQSDSRQLCLHVVRCAEFRDKLSEAPRDYFERARRQSGLQLR